MKKGIFFLVSVTFLVGMALPILADQGDQRDQGQRYRQSAPKARPAMDQKRTGDRDHRYNRDRDRDGGRDRPMDRDREYEYRSSEHHPRGYRSQAHGRHYGDAPFGRNQRYRYDGHWDSWKAWEAYRKNHQHWFREGRYYHENGHLFFRFTDPRNGNSFFFSIGR